MKIFSAAQIKACDAYTIHAGGISSIDLVERAATACATYLLGRYTPDTPFVLLCGMGNNGADGLALARILLQHGFAVKVFVLQHRQEASPENKTNLNKLLRINAALVEYMQPETFLTHLPEHVVIIDAVLGTGLTRQAEGWIGEFFRHINQLPNPKIAIDIPSGMPADSIPAKDAPILSVKETLSFQLYKRSFLHPETAAYSGHIQLLDIGLHSTFIEATATHYQTIEPPLAASLLKHRDSFSYKNQHGHIYIAGGSIGKSGAVTLCVGAALRSGSGLVTAIVPGKCYTPVQTNAQEAMCFISGDTYIDSLIPNKQADAFGIGPGMGTEEKTVTALLEFIESCTKPCVFDADALNMLALHPELMHKLPGNSILTPHVGECDRLFGNCSNSMQRVEHIRMQSMRYKVCIVLKGHHTVIVTPEGDCFYNMNGNAGMAKGGSGDVLTGLLAGLLGQGYKAEQAAILGVHLHGLAGDLAADAVGMWGMTAGDIVHYLPMAWQTLAKT